MTLQKNKSPTKQMINFGTRPVAVSLKDVDSYANFQRQAASQPDGDMISLNQKVAANPSVQFSSHL